MTVADLAPSFLRYLRATGKAPRTQTLYADAATRLSAHLSHKDVRDVSRHDVESFIARQLEHVSPTTANRDFCLLQALWKWAHEDGPRAALASNYPCARRC